MNNVKFRTFSMLVLVGIAILGMGFFTVRFVMFGEQWAGAPFNATAFQGGVLTAGSITDRNGIVLADMTDGRRTFAANGDIRRATLHAVGDRGGNIGTGALSLYAGELMGYNLITGSYSLSGAGRQLQLTIDAELSAVAHRALAGRRGAVMVSNYETGEILAMVSGPTFDPSDPPTSFDPAQGVFMNRGIQSAFSPGSTYKIVTAAAAIENISDIWSRIFVCNGVLVTGQGDVTCPGTHGSINLIQAMAVSCNVAFGELALELGGRLLDSYARSFGLSESTRIGGMSGVNTASGNFDIAPSNTAALAWSGIGQSTNTVAPASMLRFVGAIANRGEAVELHYLKRTGLSGIMPTSTARLLERNTARQLEEVIEIQNRGNFPGLEIYAKTGTAQVGGGLDPHAWFAGYIRNEGFPLAFVVVVENGGGGAAVAAPIANTVLQAAISG
ncbi:MAG: penicillin-binding transpeptidase domain-containing protein [Oscillospiraceae bacterium]|nr:penicillin-binding transpeptidase domain-containing protein [Oscillospiraceae bacterium]